jgi:peptide/nickel transport system permease protein
VFRYALRRALWALPTLFGVSIVVFLVTTLDTMTSGIQGEPPSSLQAHVALESASAAEALRIEERRSRFLDLPLFVNTSARDVRNLLSPCTETFRDSDSVGCQQLLARLGGAALPHLLPHLDEFPVPAQRRIALALKPVAERMGLYKAESFEDADQATLYWSRFWEDHSIDFTELSAKRTVLRLVEHGGDARERDLYLLDTYALPYLMQAFVAVDRRDIIVQIARLMAHVTEQPWTIASGASQSTLRARISDWRAFWFVHEYDYVAFEPGGRVLAALSETRYAKWMLGALLGELRSKDEDLSMADRLRKRALLTMSLVLLSMVLAYGIAVPLGVLTAYRQGRTIDKRIAFVLLVVYAVPTFAIAQIFLAVGGRTHASLFAVLTLVLGLVTTLSRYQRAAVIEVMSSDYIRAARSRGVFGVRLLVVHALRNAVMSTVALAGIQIPGLIGAAFVVEEVFGLRGLGWETLRAIEHHDVSWIVVVTLFTAVLSTLTLIASDIIHGMLDPRVRETLRKRMT